MKQIRMKTAGVLLLAFCLLPSAFLGGGCGLFQGSREAVSYKTLKSIQIGVDAAMKVYGTAVVTGQVAIEKQTEIDSKHMQYRSAFRLAVTAARNDLTTAPPADLQRLADELQILISSL